MALGTPFNIGSTAQASGVATTVVTAGTDANADATTMPAAGNSLFVLIGMSSGVVSPSGVTDSRGNTYTRATNGVFVSGSSQGCWVYECLNPAFTLVSTNTVTVTWSATTAATSNVRVIGCAGVATSAADDQSGTGSGSGTAASAAAGGALAQGSELAVAVIQSGNATGGVSSWGTFGQMGHNLHSGSGSYFATATLDTTSTTAPSASATMATSGNWAMLLLTFKASTAGAGGLSIVNTSPLPAGQVGVAYSDQLTATGGISPYTWLVTSGALPAGITLEPGGGSGSSGDFTYVGVNTGPQGAPTLSQFDACASALGPFGYYKVFYSAGGSGIYTGYLGGDVNGGGTTGWTSGLEGQLTTSVNGGPNLFVVVCWGVKMSTTAISNYCANIPHNIQEVGFSFQSEPEGAYGTGGGAQFVADWNDQAQKIRAAQAATPVKLTLITSSYLLPYQNGTLTNGSFQPPNQWVDVYGFDFYDRKTYWAGPDMSTNKGWINWTAVVKGLGRPLALTEYGISGASSASEQNTRLQADWAYLKAAFGSGGSLSKYPLYTWLYWNTGGLSFSTGSGSSINQMLGSAVQQTWQGIANTQSGTGGGGGGGGGGLLSGTPTTAGTSTPTIRVTDSASTTASTAFSLTISSSSALAITTTSPLPGATTGAAYSAILTASGGTSPYTWSLQSGTLPAGLSISGQLITGTPTTAGTSAFTIKVTDNVAATATLACSLTVSSTLAVTTASLPGGTVGTSYTTTLAAANGTTPYTWAVTSGSLPAGLVLDPNAGTITGTPTAAGVSTLTITVTDSASATAAAVFSISVATAAGGLAAPGRRKFGGGIADFTITASGTSISLAPAATVTFWNALTGGSQYTDLQNTGGGAITSVTSDANGELPEFWGPAGIFRMAADAGGGQRRWMLAGDTGDYLNSVYTAVHTLGG